MATTNTLRTMGFAVGTAIVRKSTEYIGGEHRQSGMKKDALALPHPRD
jgi:hypothetical protein